MCDCPAQICPNLHFPVRACGAFMALGNLAGDSHPVLAMGSAAAAQIRVHCPALPYFRFSRWAACLWVLSPQQTLDTGLEGSTPGLSPAAPSWTLAMSEASLKPVTCLPASEPRGQHPIPKGMACGRVTLSLSSAHHIEQPCWHERESVNETAEVKKMKKNWQKNIAAFSVFSFPGLPHLTAPLSQASVSSCLVQQNWQTQILP